MTFQFSHLTICTLLVINAYTQQVEFDKQVLSQTYNSEMAGFGDLNNDSHTDVVDGAYWFEGPDFTTVHEIYTPITQGDYADEFFSYVWDINKDEWNDVLVINFPGEEAIWYQNPGDAGGSWPRHSTGVIVDNETPVVIDFNGDGYVNIICANGGRLGWIDYDAGNPTMDWTFHPVSGDNGYHKFDHGLGVGDVNKDGRLDILLKDGWWQQPADIMNPEWTQIPQSFTDKREAAEPDGGSSMFVYDVDGDGDNDVVGSLQAHGWDLGWFENLDSVGTQFEKHLIMGMPDEVDIYGISFPQMHDIRLADMNGDGLLDIVTGKRVGTHGPEGDMGDVVYWFELSRAGGSISYIPHEIDVGTGIGAGLAVGDVNGDSQPDVIVGNKNGTTLFIQKTRDTGVKMSHPATQAPFHLMNRKFLYLLDGGFFDLRGKLFSK